MTFYNKKNKKITQEEWIEEFEPYYFLGGPTYDRSINRGKQGSKFVEDEIEKILKNGLEANDIPFVIAWKIGAIDHKMSELGQKIVFLKNFDETLEFPDRYGIIRAKKIIDYCKTNFDYLSKLGDEAKNSEFKAEELFNNLKHNVGEKKRFGIVKLLALLYFFTQRHWPIYDQFVHKAVNAIISDTKPDEHINYTSFNDFGEYRKKYVEKNKEIFGRQDIGRDIDRALWVYGHFFNKNNNCNKTTNMCHLQKKNKKS